MELFPAIDIRHGQAVRLRQGDYADMKVYAANPTEVAQGFLLEGARSLHVVDLDGAKDGKAMNAGLIGEIAAIEGLFVQVGGGIRDEARIAHYLERGVDRVILGTVAVKNFPFVEDMVCKYGGRIAVGVDAREGKVSVAGWLETTALDAFAFCKKLRDAGVSTVIYTDIARDGGLTGANLPAYRTLCEIEGLNIIASGGVSYEHEIETLRGMGVHGVIVGKALYEHRLSLKRLLELARGVKTRC